MTNIVLGKEGHFSQPVRLIALLVYIFVLLAFSKFITGEWVPLEEGRRLWILAGIGLWFFGLISAPFFRPPRDSLANAVAVGLVLLTIDLSAVQKLVDEIELFRWLSVGIALVVVVAAISAMITVYADPADKPDIAIAAKFSHRLSDSLGRGEVLFTPIALISIIGFYQGTPITQMWLLFAWVFLVSVKPVELALRLFIDFRNLRNTSKDATFLGIIRRVDNPNVVRVTLDASANWGDGALAIGCLPNRRQVLILPLFKHVQDTEIVGTGLMHGTPEIELSGAVEGHVYQLEPPIDTTQFVDELSGVPGGADLTGFVLEGSTIPIIRFEAASRDAVLEEGMLIFCKQREQTIYYQILGAETVEETFDRNPRGKHVVSAAQLGIIEPEKGFVKYGWLPAMNSPVFISKSAISGSAEERNEDEFPVGKVPGSDVSIRVGFSDLVGYHAAILGVTGTGKTELVFDILENALERGTKVFCVDFTGEYAVRLAGHGPKDIGLDRAMASELDQKLFAVETGNYGAGNEKKALKEFVDLIRPHVAKSASDFLEPDGSALGIFSLPEITNTKASLRATEMYLSTIMEWARLHRKARRVLVVLEEAHTVIPETAGSGFDFDTQWVVSRISQIALQGRKYGVGLLIVSQRTALVSKSILSQCNTHFTFNLVDKTSLDYLSNVYSAEHVRCIPNLRFLEALVYGKAVRSERPVLIMREFDESKKVASDALDVSFGSAKGEADEAETEEVVKAFPDGD